MEKHTLALPVNGSDRRMEIEPRRLLSDVLRNELGLTGTKRGCDTAKCGACTVLLDGDPVKACNVLAMQANGRDVTTIEGLLEGDELSPAQRAFWEEYSFQCGYCTPGFLMTTNDLISDTPDPDESEIRDHLAGNVCRCTGYVKIVEGVKEAARIEHCSEGTDEGSASDTARGGDAR